MAGGGQSVMQALAAQTPQIGPGLLGDISDWLDSQRQSVKDAAQAAAQRRGLLGSVVPEVRQKGLADMMASPAMQMAMGFAPFGHVVYHGSPHTFDAFDASKIGTGEGAQAYGHGMYFAENPAVAKDYANTLSTKIDVGGSPFYAGNKTFATTGNSDLDMYILAHLGDANAIRSDLLDATREMRANNQTTSLKSYQQLMADFRKVRPDMQVSGKGNLYKADIPDELIPKMLDWDKPLSQQPQAVQDIVNTTAKQHFPWLDSLPDMLGSDIYHFLSYKNPADSTAAWKNAGIPGIRYLDAGSRGAGEGTYNYVLFDPSVAKIIGRE